MEELLQIVDSPEMNELHRAVLDNRLEAVKYLVKNGVDVTNTTLKGQTPLHVATNLNNHAIMRALLECKSRDALRELINARTVDTGSTALHVAAGHNSLESVKLLLSYGAKFEMRNGDLQQPLSFASEKSIKELMENVKEVFELTRVLNYDILAEKLNSFSPENTSVIAYARNDQDDTVLQAAMRVPNMNALAEIINWKIANTEQQNCVVGADKLDALTRHSKAARSRLSNFDAFHYGSCIDACKKEIMDFLHSSCEFLEACKEQDHRNFLQQPLLAVIEESLQYFLGSREAYRFVDVERVDWMLGRGFEFATKMLKICIMAPMLLFMKSVYTFELLNAAKNNDLNWVEKCLIGHPSLNGVDGNNWTALHHAFYHSNHEMAKLLLQHGADPMASDASGKNLPVSHLLLSLQQQRLLLPPRLDDLDSKPIEIEAVKLLLQSIKDDDKRAEYIDARNDDGWTALHLAAKMANRPLVRCLLSQGHIYCPKNKKGELPSSYLPICIFDVNANPFDSLDELFAQAFHGQTKMMFERIRESGRRDLSVVFGTRNAKGLTLLQILDRQGLTDATDRIRKMLAKTTCSVKE